MQISLRPYQRKFIDDIREQMQQGHRRVCGVAPCGSGKTIMTGWMAKEVAENDKRVLFMVHRQELIEQTSKTFYDLEIDHGIIAAGIQPDYDLPVQVASVQTLVRRLDKVPPPDLLICDECHHILASNYMKIIDKWHPWLLGVTATPERLGGVTLNDVFSSMVIGPSVGSLIKKKNLTNFKYFAPKSSFDTSKLRSKFGEFRSDDMLDLMDRQEIIGDVIKSYQKYADGKQTIVYCVNVEHSKHTANLFNQSGIVAAHVDGETQKTERREIIEAFRYGDIQVLCNAELFGEGFDVPNCDCVILTRPTQSLTLFIQQSMRCMRPNPNNPNKVAIIIDHVENVKRFGLPDEDRQWSLYPNDTKDSQAAPTKHCDKCDSEVHLATRVCPTILLHKDEISSIDETDDSITIHAFSGDDVYLEKANFLDQVGNKVREPFDKDGNYICGKVFPFDAVKHKKGELDKYIDTTSKDYSNSRSDNKIVTAPTTIEELLIAAEATGHKKYWAAMKAITYAKTLEECLRIARVCGYKDAWARLQWKEKKETDDFSNAWANRSK